MSLVAALIELATWNIVGVNRHYVYSAFDGVVMEAELPALLVRLVKRSGDSASAINVEFSSGAVLLRVDHVLLIRGAGTGIRADSQSEFVAHIDNYLIAVADDFRLNNKLARPLAIVGIEPGLVEHGGMVYEGIVFEHEWLLEFGSFIPSDQSGLVAWYDANDAATIWQDSAKTTAAGVGDVVGAWADKSGLGHDLLQATTSLKPTRQSGYIDFDGIDDYLNVVFSAEYAQPNTVFVVAKFDVGGVTQYIMDGLDSGHRVAFYVSSGASMQSFGGSAGLFDPSVGDTNVGLLAVVFNGVFSLLRRDTTEVSRDLGSHSATGLYVGVNYLVLKNLNGRVLELCVYEGLLSSKEIARVENYLNTKWSIY